MCQESSEEGKWFWDYKSERFHGMEVSELDLGKDLKGCWRGPAGCPGTKGRVIICSPEKVAKEPRWQWGDGVRGPQRTQQTSVRALPRRLELRKERSLGLEQSWAL